MTAFWCTLPENVSKLKCSHPHYYQVQRSIVTTRKLWGACPKNETV